MTADISELRAYLESRYRGVVSFLQLDETVSGEVYKEAIAVAASRMTEAVVTVDTLDNTDIASLTEHELMLHSELALVDNMLGNFAAVDTSVGGRTQQFNQLRIWLNARHEELTTEINSKYSSAGVAELTLGRIVNYDAAEIDESVGYDALG